jgi:hypothetical protein
MAAPSEEEILAALLQEVELLAAEGEEALDLDSERLSPMASMILVSSWPARPTKGSP